MTTNSQLLTTEPKTKTKTNYANNSNRNRITEMEITWRDIIGDGEGGREGMGRMELSEGAEMGQL